MWVKGYKVSTHRDVNHPGLKVTTAWLTTLLASTWQSFHGIPWDKLAQFAAFVYSCVLIYEWVSKKIQKSRGTYKPTDLGDL